MEENVLNTVANKTQVSAADKAKVMDTSIENTPGMAGAISAPAKTASAVMDEALKKGITNDDRQTTDLRAKIDAITNFGPNDPVTASNFGPNDPVTATVVSKRIFFFEIRP